MKQLLSRTTLSFIIFLILFIPIWESNIVLAFLPQHLADSASFSNKLKDEAINQLNKNLELAEFYIYNDLKKANKIYFETLKQVANEIPEYYKGIIWSNIAVNYARMAKYDSADLMMQLASGIANKYPKEGDLQVVYNLCQAVHHKLKNHFAESLNYSKRAIEYRQNATQRKWAAHAYLNIGSVLHLTGDYLNAITFDNLSAELFERENNDQGLSFAFFQIGLLLNQNKDYQHAEKYYQQSIAIQERIGQKKGLANGLGHLSMLYFDTKKFPLALETIERAISVSEVLGQIAIHNHNKIYKAIILSRLQEKKRALSLLDECETTAKDTGNKDQLATVFTEKARIEMDKSPMIAIRLLKEGIHYAEESKAVDPRLKIYELAAVCFSKINDYKEAYRNSHKLQLLSDSLTRTNLNERLKIMEVEKQLTLKEREIIILNKDKQVKMAELKKQQAILMGIAIALVSIVVIGLVIINRNKVVLNANKELEIEKMRNQIARDLHDDLGSSLSNIKILSQVAIQNQSEFSMSMLKIRDKATLLLDSMSDIVWSINSANDSAVGLTARMKEFCVEILEPKNIAFSFLDQLSQADWKPTIDQKRNVFLFFKEAINNLAKYSNATQVDVGLFNNSDGFTMKVTDNGVGFDTDMITNGNGINNMRERAKNMNGEFIIYSKPGNGTAVQLTLTLT